MTIKMDLGGYEKVVGYDLNQTGSVFYGFTQEGINKIQKDEADFAQSLKNETKEKESQRYQEGSKKVSHMQRLTSDYLNATAYYYDKSANEIIGLDIHGNMSKVDYEMSRHLRELNGI